MAVDETTFGNTNADELSESELEQYGVWVKSAPEDLDEDSEDSFQLEDFSVDELEDSARSFLGEEETQEQEFDDDIFDEVPVFSDEEEDLLAELERSGPSGSDEPLEGADEVPDTSVSAEDNFEVTGGKSYTLDIDDAPSDITEDLDLEKFGDEHDTFDDIEQEFDAVEPTEASIDLGGEFEVPGEKTEFNPGDYPDLDLNATSLPDDEDENDYDDIQIDLDHDSSLPELELDEQTDHGVSDLTPDEEQLLRDAADSVEATEKDDEMDQAAYRLLEKIQEEIAGIKEELHEVREDIADIRSSRGSSADSDASTSQSSKTQASEETSGLLDPGFFEEDEDETIALTGDELDNILNTADFVETTGEPTPVDDSLSDTTDSDSSEALLSEMTDDASQDSDSYDINSALDDIDLDDTKQESDFDISFEQEDADETDSPEAELSQEDIIPLGEELEPEEELPETAGHIEVADEYDAEGDSDEITIDIEDDDEPELDTQPDTTEELGDLEVDLELDDDLDLDDLESELDELEEEDISLPTEPLQADTSEPPIEEISLDDEFNLEEEASESDAAPAGFPGDEEAALELETPPVDTSELDTLAQLDIDSELADIDELKDSPDDTIADTSELDDISIEFPGEEFKEEPDEQEIASKSELIPDETQMEPETDDDELVIGEELDLEEDSVELADDDLDEVEISEDEFDEATTSGDIEEELNEEDLEIESENEPSRSAQGLSATMAAAQEAADNDTELSDDLREEIRAVLRYMDQLLESLPEDKIQEFASSEHFEVYKKLFEELGLET